MLYNFLIIKHIRNKEYFIIVNTFHTAPIYDDDDLDLIISLSSIVIISTSCSLRTSA